MVAKSSIALTALILVGCGSKQAKPEVVDRSLPSLWKIKDVRYSPEVTLADPTPDGKAFYWQAVDFQNSGEEKVQFEVKQGKPPESKVPDPPKIQLIGIPEDMFAVREMARHLVSAATRKTLPVAKFGFGPFGLSNDLYFGHTFWDADVWMLPALLFLEPQGATDIAKYRLDRVGKAKENFDIWRSDASYVVTGLKFPWESSVSGKEVCVAKTKLQEHISGDVVWGLSQAEAMGLVDSKSVEAVATGVGSYYQWRSKSTARGKEIQDVVSPNEKFTGDNDLYTNLLAEWITNGRQWKEKPTYYLPKDDKSFLNYDNDPMRDYQQVAGLLSIYPLQYPPAEKQAEVMLNRFESGLSSNGVAMGHSIIATIWARLGQGHKAYLAWKQSWVPYTTGPNHLFSERKNVSRPYFYTGAAGALNTVIYGFAGFRIDRTPLNDAKWTKHFKSGWWLSCKPCVPGEIGKILLNDISLDGEKYNFVMSSTGEFSATKVSPKG